MEITNLLDSLNKSCREQLELYFEQLFDKIHNDNFYYMSSLFLDHHFCYNQKEIFNKSNNLKIIKDTIEKLDFFKLKFKRDVEFKKNVVVISDENGIYMTCKPVIPVLSINDFCKDESPENYTINRNAIFNEISKKHKKDDQYNFITDLDDNHTIRSGRIGISKNNVELFADFFTSILLNMNLGYKLYRNKIILSKKLNSNIEFNIDYSLNEFKENLRLGTLRFSKPKFFIIIDKKSHEILLTYNSFFFIEDIMYNYSLHDTVRRFHTLIEAHTYHLDNLTKIIETSFQLSSE